MSSSTWTKVKAGRYAYGRWEARRFYDRAAGGVQWRLDDVGERSLGARNRWFDTLRDVKDWVADYEASKVDG